MVRSEANARKSRRNDAGTAIAEAPPDTYRELLEEVRELLEEVNLVRLDGVRAANLKDRMEFTIGDELNPILYRQGTWNHANGVTLAVVPGYGLWFNFGPLTKELQDVLYVVCNQGRRTLMPVLLSDGACVDPIGMEDRRRNPNCKP